MYKGVDELMLGISQSQYTSILKACDDQRSEEIGGLPSALREHLARML